MTILTVGFGDLYPTETAGRAILIPYSVGGIIMLGLVIGAIFKSVEELGEKNIVRHHFEVQAQREKGRTVRSSLELHRREIELELQHERAMAKQAARPSARSTGTVKHYAASLDRRNSFGSIGGGGGNLLTGLSRQSSIQSHVKKNKQVVMLREEKERFEAMRKIQHKSQVWRNWYRLTVTLSIFATFWCLGAVFFWAADRSTTGQSYWETIYFCWVALLSIGYGDFSPKTGAGRCFFIIWSLIAVPTMTILASDLTSTVISVFHHWSNSLADLTIMPQYGMWRDLIDNNRWLFLHLPTWLEKRAQQKAAESEQDEEKEANKPFETERNNSSGGAMSKDDQLAAGTLKADIENLVAQHDRDILKVPDATALARQLAFAIRRTAHDLMLEKPRDYTYEEWAEFTRLIRFSAVGGPGEALKEAEEGMIEWDWIGEDSPMMAQGTETQFILERLVESLVRYLKRNPPNREFADTLKEKGEDALRLKGGAGAGEEEDDTMASGSANTSLFSGIRQDGAGSIRSWKGSTVSGGPEADAIAMGGGLHPVEEHEDEHAIHPVPPKNSQV